MDSSPLRIEVLRDSNDVTVLVSGALLKESLSHARILDISKLLGAPKAVKLTDVTFAIEKGLCLYLWWEDRERDSLILPINEGQGRVDFDAVGGLHNPRRAEWTGHVELSSKQVSWTDDGEEKNFTLILGFSKVRE